MKSISSKKLKGNILIPGDKSISHRLVILSSVAIGKSNIKGILKSDDIMKTIEAMQNFGASIEFKNSSNCSIKGVGLGGLSEPKSALDFGNSGTAARLVMGLSASHPITTIYVGDTSLSTRPMDRVLKPLVNFGSNYSLRKDNYLPAILKGSDNPIPFSFNLREPSAQIKSAVLLGSLNTPGVTTVKDKFNTRDHTERLLELYGANINITKKRNIKEISVKGVNELKGIDVNVPGDPSSALFPIIAALICKNSDIIVKNVLINPTRDGAYRVLKDMGADISFLNQRIMAAEEVYDIRVKSSNLKGVDIPSKLSPTMIDDYPILAVAASMAKGKTYFKGINELRFKESDRFNGILNLLEKNGVKVESIKDTIIIHGKCELKKGGIEIETNLDHRMAMSALIMGLVSKKEIKIDNSDTIKTSFPSFYKVMIKIGAKLSKK
jgi:3-phosphoshikimate 1-carboxyvinyltransferase